MGPLARIAPGENAPAPGGPVASSERAASVPPFSAREPATVAPERSTPAGAVFVFDGLNSSSAGCACSQPDVSLAVGPNAVLELVESRAAWFTTGAVPIANESLAAFFQAGNDTVVYPQASFVESLGRFLAVASDPSAGALLLGVSASSGWSSSWSFFRLPGNGSYELGPPSLGASATTLGVASDAYGPGSSQPVGSELWVANLSSLLTGGPLRLESFGPVGVEPGTRAVRSAGVDPRPGFQYFVAENASGELLLSAASGAPPLPVELTTAAVVPLTAYGAPVAIPQPNTTDLLRAPAPGISDAVWSNGSVATVSTVLFDGLDEVELVQFNASTGALRQDLLLSNGADLAHPALTADGAGDLAIVADTANSTLYPSLVAVGQPSNEPGRSSAFETLAAGTVDAGTPCNATGVCDWGNSSAAVADPLEPLEAWLAGEYAGASGTNWSTSIGLVHYPPLSSASILSDVPSVDVGQAVNFTVFATGGTGNLSYNWSGGLPSGCAPADLPTVMCWPSSPGPSRVVVTVTDGAGVSTRPPPLLFNVSSALAMGVPEASQNSSDVGQAVEFVAGASGGLLPYSYQWRAPPAPVCIGSTSARLTCAFPTVSTAHVSVTVTDANLASIGNSTAIPVYPLPNISGVFADPNPDPALGEVNLSVNVSGGSGGLVYNWSGLPEGCPGVDSARIRCLPADGGRFDVDVTVHDSNGAYANGSLRLTVTPQVRPGAASYPPWAPFAVLLSIVVAVGLGVLLYRYNRRTGEPPRERGRRGSADK